MSAAVRSGRRFLILICEAAARIVRVESLLTSGACHQWPNGRATVASHTAKLFCEWYAQELRAAINSDQCGFDGGHADCGAIHDLRSDEAHHATLPVAINQEQRVDAC